MLSEISVRKSLVPMADMLTPYRQGWEWKAMQALILIILEKGVTRGQSLKAQEANSWTLLETQISICFGARPVQLYEGALLKAVLIYLLRSISLLYPLNFSKFF